MTTLANNLVTVAVVSVAVVLVLGLLTMARGDNPSRSQQLMRWRVGLQFFAVIVIMTVIYFASK